MPADVESQNSSKRLLRKLAVAARLFGSELYRLKLKRVDLSKADLRLGEKGYATGVTEGEPELVSRLDRVAERLKQLRQQERRAGSTLGEKAKLLASRIGKAIQIGALKLRRRRILRQLGTSLRQGGTNSSEEARSASAVADRITATEAAITGLRPQTYPWARRPVLLASLLLLLMGVGGAFMVSNQHIADLAQQRGAATSGLSDAQMNKILAQQQAFAQQTQQMVAEASRRETEQRQARIAAAERQYREQRDRERAEVEKRQREEAAEQERVAAGRAKAEAEEAQRKAAEEKQAEAAQVAAAKQQEAREKAELERQQAERERIAAETRKREEGQAQVARERAEREAQERQLLAGEKKKEEDRIADEAKKKKQAQQEQAEHEATEKLRAFREQVRNELLNNARLKVLCHLEDRLRLGTELCADKAGNLYGIIEAPPSKEAVFRITPKGDFARLSSFDDEDFEMGEPGRLVQADDGNFYGATFHGVIYKITPEGQYSVIHKFGRSEGARPAGALVRGKDGNFYGVTRGGGAGEGGTIFKVTPEGKLTTLHNFVKDSDDGCCPEGGLIQGSDGNFYGTTSSGGTNGGRARMTAQGLRYGSAEQQGTKNGGTIFRMTPAGEVTILHRLNERAWNEKDEHEGAHPKEALVEGTDRNLYGTTSEAGQHSHGTIFKMTPRGELTVLHDFRDEGPVVGGMVRAADGNLYGITVGLFRDRSHCGTIFKVGSDGQMKVVYAFKYRGGETGWNWFGFYDPITPVSRLLSGSDGKLYGVTDAGGKKDAGVVFQFDPSDNFVASQEAQAKAEHTAAHAFPPKFRPSAGDIISEIVSDRIQRAAEAEAGRLNHSKRVVAESGGAKMLCPKCDGYKKMVQHDYDYSLNPHAGGTLAHAYFEIGRESTNIVNCDRCGGTGVVNAR